MTDKARGLRLCWLTVACTILLAACGGGGSDSQTNNDGTNSAPPPTVTPTPVGGGSENARPTVAGIPLDTALQGRLYSFAPTTNDADGELLTFSIAGLPKWATFNTATGRISGTPAPEDVGTYGGITISVTDGLDTASLPAFSISVVGTASGAVTLSWEPPTENEDGTPLMDLAGYHVYWGTSNGEYTNFATVSDAGTTSFVVDELTAATWYFATTAFNSDGFESDYSDTKSTTIR